MKLARTERTFLHVTFADLPEGATVEAQFGDSAWFPMTGTGQTRSILVAGPTVTQGDALYVITATCTMTIRITDTPEILPRKAGTITLTD